jgi:alanine racemase
MPGRSEDLWEGESFGARALIRLPALRHNLERVRNELPDASVLAVVKANAYGHGLEDVARELESVDALAVARLPEAIRIRRAGVGTPVVLLSGVSTAAELAACTLNSFEIVVHAREQIALLDGHVGPPLVCWLKVDTGMTRLGFTPGEARALVDRLECHPAVAELRLMTHFASADETANPFTHEQMERFLAVTRGFAGDVSFANSPGMFGWELCANARQQLGFSGDLWIRPGIALYGISPFAGNTGTELGLLPVMQFEARVIAVKPMLRGSRVGYQGSHVATVDSMVGIIAAGYGDGYTRHFRTGTPILLNGRRVPLIGRVSMDMLAVDLGPEADDRPGDIAILWGDGLPVEEVAPYADAIPYELVCGITNREQSCAVRG